MKDMESNLTAARLREVLHYEPQTGVFHWIVTTSSRRPVGSVAGGPTSTGYARIGVDGVRYRSHRLAWLYMTGEWPSDQVDHKDNDRLNNRWENLRLVDNQMNQGNSGMSRNNTSGVKGVFWSKQRQQWQTKININRRQIHGGYFHNLDDAAASYAALASKYFGEFARHARANSGALH